MYKFINHFLFLVTRTMDIIRKIFDGGYDISRNGIFHLTRKDPEKAHEFFVEFTKLVSEMGLEKALLDNSSNKKEFPFEFSNAAGFNKNGDIPLSFLKYLGFNRVVVGTVTNDAWKGNERPRIQRFIETESLVNWMGLPGVGSKRVGENLHENLDNVIKGSLQYIPVTINFMSTPGKTGDELLRDLEGTILNTSYYCDRFSLNISCPNTHSSSGSLDARSQYQKNLDSMLKLMINYASDKELYVKISPDLSIQGIVEILDVLQDNSKIVGVEGTNTTTNHLPNYICVSPGKGGASGNAVKHKSLVIQEQFLEEMKLRKMNLKYIAVGGIDSAEEAEKRINQGANGIQIFTPLIFKGPKLIREIRDYYAKKDLSYMVGFKGIAD